MTADAEQLPDLSARWMQGLLGEDIPRERRATSASCAMCAPARKPASAVHRYFDPDVKCCSYHPILANFLVGRALADSDPAASASMEARLAAETATATPMGLGQPPVYATLYDRATKAFGVSKALRCPHYVVETGGCGVWRHRNAVCTTWFCKFERGETGSEFWSATHRLLGALELALARHCVAELDIGADAMARLTRHPAWSNGTPRPGAADLDGRPDAANRDLWGRWHGREREFYRRAGEIVAAHSWPEALALAGSEARGLALAVKARFAALKSERVPERLVLAPASVIASGPQSLRLKTFSEFDPLDIPPVLFEALRFFQGGPNDEALAAIVAELGVSLEPELVRKLADFGVLKPADAPEG
jgi:hypothetical protein